LISFFPSFYDDEMLFSVIGRYHKWSPNKTSTQTLKDLFSPHGTVNFGALISRLENFRPNSLEEIYFKHSTLGYDLFMFPKKEEVLKRISTVGKISGIYLKFCYKCLLEDVEMLGEGYWRASFQIPTMFYCLKHNELLYVSETPYSIRSVMDSNIETNLKEIDKLNCSRKRFSKKTYIILMRLSVESNYLFRNNIECSNIDWSLLLFKRFQEKKLINSQGLLRVNAAVYQLSQFYGKEFLMEFLERDVLQILNSITWALGNANIRNVLPPNEFLIVLIFLFGNIKNLIQETVEIKAINDEKCLECGQENTLKYRLFNNEERLLAFGTCACGFTKSILHGDNKVIHESLVVRFSTVKAEEEFIYDKIFVDNMSIEKLSYRLNVDTVSLERKVASILKNKKENRELSDYIKYNWDLILNCTSFSLEELKVLHFDKYVWLLTYCPEFLFDFTYPVLKGSKNSVLKKRDKQMKAHLKSYLRPTLPEGEDKKHSIYLLNVYAMQFVNSYNEELQLLPETMKYIRSLQSLLAKTNNASGLKFLTIPH